MEDGRTAVSEVVKLSKTNGDVDFAPVVDMKPGESRSLEASCFVGVRGEKSWRRGQAVSEKL